MLCFDLGGGGGHKMYGRQYREQISESVRRAAELCDCLQCFFVKHSMGGGKCLVLGYEVNMFFFGNGLEEVFDET